LSSKLKILAYVCENHALSAVRAACSSGESLPDSIQIVELPCTGRVETVHLLEAIRGGADGVVVIGCLEENCYHDAGPKLARGRVERIKEVLQDISIEPERVEMINVASVSGARLILRLRAFENKLAELPTSPFKGAIK